MLEVYSNNVTANMASSIPLNNVSLVKGRTAIKDGNTISLNVCGVYEVSVDGTVTVPTDGTVTIQLEKDGVLQPQSLATVIGTADTDSVPFSFVTLVQVPFTNSPCPCSAPTLIDIISSVEATYPHINVVVTKLV